MLTIGNLTYRSFYEIMTLKLFLRITYRDERNPIESTNSNRKRWINLFNKVPHIDKSHKSLKSILQRYGERISAGLAEMAPEEVNDWLLLSLKCNFQHIY